MAVDHHVIDHPGGVIALVFGTQQFAAKPRCEFVDRRAAERALAAAGRRDPSAPNHFFLGCGYFFGIELAPACATAQTRSFPWVDEFVSVIMAGGAPPPRRCPHCARLRRPPG